jgi:hypothetical protein
MPVAAKEKTDRVNESAHLLKQLEDIGFLDTSQGYKDIKVVFDKWIEDGVAWAGKVKLPEYRRVADIILTNKVGTTASLRLRAV